MMWGNFVRLQLGNGQRFVRLYTFLFFVCILQSVISICESCDLPGMSLLV
jgi:hypothetical protein